MKGILGKKIGMTEVFTKDGKLIPVTVVSCEPNTVMQVKTKATDGYEAIQLGITDKKEKRANKAEIGHAKKANVSPKRFLKEIRGVNPSDYSLGQTLKVEDVFAAGEMVDVTGISKGKGFQGVIKRWNQSRGPMGHGSKYHRGVGSLGTMLPMHVIKGKKMPGQMGNVQRTVQNLEVVSIDTENNVILIKGNVPGPKKSFVMIHDSVKTSKTKDAAKLISYVEEVAPAEEVAEETTEAVEAPVEEPVEETPVEEAKEETTEEKTEE